MKHKTTTLALMLLLFMATTNAELSGVAKDYVRGGLLEVNSGESVLYHFRIQNMGYEDTNVSIDLLEGNEITSLPFNNIIVPAKTTNTQVTINITAPKSHGNQTKSIKLKFTAENPSTQGNVALAKSFETGVQVLIVGTNSYIWVWVIIISLLLLLVLGGIIWIRKK